MACQMENIAVHHTSIVQILKEFSPIHLQKISICHLSYNHGRELTGQPSKKSLNSITLGLLPYLGIETPPREVNAVFPEKNGI